MFLRITNAHGAMKIDLPYYYPYDKRRAADHELSISLCWARAIIENGMTGNSDISLDYSLFLTTLKPSSQLQ